MTKIWGLLAAALGAAALVAPLHGADIQERFNVVANALAASDSIKIEKMAVSGFAAGAGANEGPLGRFLEDGLRQAFKQHDAWSVLGPQESSAGADALVTGSYLRDGSELRVHVVLLSQPERAVLWSRNLVLDTAELDPGLLKAPADEFPEQSTMEMDDETQEAVPAPGDESQVVPSLPRRRLRRHHPFHYDLNVAYKAFFPTNSSLQKLAGLRMDGLSLGMSFNDVVLLDADFWSQPVNGFGSVQSLDYAGSSLGLTYPMRFGHWLCLYLGPGGRFGSLIVNDTQLNYGSVAFGNNALVGMAGAKFSMDSVGLDFRYTYDLVSSYTGYHTARLGFFYEFGH